MTDAEYMRQYRLSRKRKAFDLLGGKCVVCGTCDNLEFDHIDPATKSFNISRFFGTWNEMVAELSKCQLLCHTHHLEKTSSEGRKLKEFCKKGHPLALYRKGGRCYLCVSTRKRRWRKQRRGSGLKVT